MPEHKVLYVDEDPAENNRFTRSFVNDFVVDTVDFEGITFDQLAAQLEEKDFDYLVVDYHLNEKSNCGFDGDAVIKNFVAKFPHFPTMLLTNHDEGAIEGIADFDVEKIRSKKEYTSDEFKVAFTKRMKAKIDEYKKQNTEAQERVQQLIEKKNSGQELTAEEEVEVIRLDTFLDETLGAESPKIPDEMKSTTNTQRLETILEKTDSLIEKLKEYETLS
jgi:DNA-binding NarL/FixJ family response regulator